MPALHIAQGGIGDDRKQIEAAARTNRPTIPWIVPKSAEIGDEVAVYFGNAGLVATGYVASEPKPRSNWKGRYEAKLKDVRLITPPISLEVLRKQIPNFAWTTYPRSIVTPAGSTPNRLRAIITRRRETLLPNLDDDTLAIASMEERRAVAIAASRPHIPAKIRVSLVRVGSKTIASYVVDRANGYCEGCESKAPFIRENGVPYLEPHHITGRAEGGRDDPRDMIALCPNCHRRVHHSRDQVKFGNRLRAKLWKIEKL